MGERLPMVDLHTHLLPGLDDGPEDIDESLRMCELYVAQGVETVVATPHMGDHALACTPADVRRGVESLSRACRRRGLALEILAGGEVRLPPDLLGALSSGSVLTIADTGRHLLLEFPAQRVPRIEDLIFRLRVQGVTPVIAHPELHPVFAPRRSSALADLVEQGCLGQVTGGSLLGRFGRAARRAAERFVTCGLAHVVASDAHSSCGRRPDFGPVAERLSALAGEDVARRLVAANPGRIVRGLALTAPDAALRDAAARLHDVPDRDDVPDSHNRARIRA